MAVPNDIILYTYPFSPYGQRISQYLQLRGIEHALCEQPVQLPRPDIELLNLAYRRIPVLAIGRDLYCDTHIILDKLEQLWPNGKLGGRTDDERAIEKLLDRYITGTGIFWKAAGLIPPETPILADEKFIKDREDLAGITMNAENQRKGRPDAIVGIADMFAFLETTLLADGRDWLLKSDKPMLADMQVAWVLVWLDSMPGAVPKEVAERYPKVGAFTKRFREAVKSKNAPEPPKISGEDAAKHIAKSSYAETPATVDEHDGTGLKSGATVEVASSDYAQRHKTAGRLVSLTPSEVAIAVKMKSGDEYLVHFPRWGFTVRPVASKL